MRKSVVTLASLATLATSAAVFAAGPAVVHKPKSAALSNSLADLARGAIDRVTWLGGCMPALRSLAQGHGPTTAQRQAACLGYPREWVAPAGRGPTWTFEVLKFKAFPPEAARSTCILIELAGAKRSLFALHVPCTGWHVAH